MEVKCLIELILDDDIDGIANKGDTIILKADRTFEVKPDTLQRILKKEACKDITELFEKMLIDWYEKGESDISNIEKIIDSCKSEGGNVNA